MIRMFVRHAVTNFDEWKQGYDAFDDERKGLGVVGDAVFQGANDPNDVTVWHDFESIESAKAFSESARLREVMSKAGVASQPEIWFTNQS